MPETATKFSCEGCNRQYTWKPELAGKRVKCKCGHVMTVSEAPPVPPAPQEDPDALFDLAPDPEQAKPKKRVPLAPIRQREQEREHVSVPVMSGNAAAATAPLGYQHGPTARESARASSDVVLDMKRDVHVPAALLVIGFLLYIGYYAFAYSLGGTGIAVTGIGLGIMTAIKAAMLVGFAFIVAGPLGVSFGGVGTAVLKLAAIAVFCDGVSAWVDYGVDEMTGGAGGAFAGMMSFPVGLGIYWVLLIYLFDMDSGDSWMVVMVLTVFDYIVRMALMLLVLGVILSWGGVSGSALPAFGASAADPMREQIKEMKKLNQLEEAKQYIAGGRQEVFTGPVNDWYAAGCPNVWFVVDRDINGRATPEGVIVEMPKDKAKRAEVFQIYKKYLESVQIPVDEEDMVDEGDDFLEVPLRGGGGFGF